MPVEIRAFMGNPTADLQKLAAEINLKLSRFHSDKNDLVESKVRLLDEEERSKIEAQIIYESSLLGIYQLVFENWKGPESEFAKVWYNMNTEMMHTEAGMKMVAHIVFDLNPEIANSPEFIGELDVILKTHTMLDEGKKITIKDKINELTRIIRIERTSDNFKREQLHVMFTKKDYGGKKTHIFLKPWAEATWERTDRHLDPKEIDLPTHYTINAWEDSETGATKVVHTEIDVSKIKPNK